MSVYVLVPQQSGIAFEIQMDGSLGLCIQQKINIIHTN